MQVGKWLDLQGIDVKPSARPAAVPALPAVPSHKTTEKLLAAVYAPLNDIDNGKHQPVKVNICHFTRQLRRTSACNLLTRHKQRAVKVCTSYMLWLAVPPN